MEIAEILVCRLCWKICKNHYEIIGEGIQAMINYIHLTVDLGVSHEQVICNVCLDDLKKCSDFKAACLNKRNMICDMHENSIFKTSDWSTKGNLAVKAEDCFVNDVCFLCGERMDSITVLTEEIKNLTSVIEIYLSEIDLKATRENCLLCKSCCISLQHCCSFLSNWLGIEEKVKEYRDAKGTNNNGQIELNSVRHFISNYDSYDDIQSSSNAIKVEEKYEQINNKAIIEVKSEDFLLGGQKPCDIKEENIPAKVEQDDDRFGDNMHPLEASDASTIVNKSGFQNHLQTHNSTFGNTVHNSENRTFTSNCKDNVPTRMLSDENLDKWRVQIHTTIHQNRPMMHKCEVCTYETKYDKNIRQHMLRHKTSSEVIMFKCELCSFETKHKPSLTRHIFTHRNLSDVMPYKCEVCEFQTKCKITLQRHMPTHIYKCEECAFQSRHKQALRLHMKIHSGSAEVRMYKCEQCSFESKRKLILQYHLSSHGNPSDVTVYKCEVCEFYTEHNSNLHRHMLTHKSMSEVTVYKCEKCVFQSKYKQNVQLHMRVHTGSARILTHKSTVEVRMYKCDVCSYDTKYKGVLQRHMLRHQSASDIPDGIRKEPPAQVTSMEKM